MTEITAAEIRIMAEITGKQYAINQGNILQQLRLPLPKAGEETRQPPKLHKSKQSTHLSPGSGERPQPPPPLMRDNSEVLNRVIVSDPRVDAQREQERIAESQPVPLGSDVTPVTGLGLVGSEGVEDGGRGSQRRQDIPGRLQDEKMCNLAIMSLGQTLGEGEFGKVKLGWKRMAACKSRSS